MKKSIYIYLLILNLIIFTSCKDREEEKPPTRVIIKPKVVVEELKAKIDRPKEYSFNLRDVENRAIDIKIKSDHYRFLKIKEPIVLLYLFSTWCPPCIGQIPHLNSIQKRYANRVSIIGVLLYDEKIEDDYLYRFIISQKIDFFISNRVNKNMEFVKFISPKLNLKRDFPVPIMILFVEGRYYTHYEGSTPQEMIESDIKQALKKIELK